MFPRVAFGYGTFLWGSLFCMGSKSETRCAGLALQLCSHTVIKLTLLLHHAPKNVSVAFRHEKASYLLLPVIIATLEAVLRQSLSLSSSPVPSVMYSNNNTTNNGGSSSSYTQQGAAPGYGGYGFGGSSGGAMPGAGAGAGPSTASASAGVSSMRRRNLDPSSLSSSSSSPTNGRSSLSHRGGGTSQQAPPRSTVIKNLDFMFPKVDTEYTVRTDGGGVASLVAMGVVLLLVVAEVLSWRYSNTITTEHIRVDASLGQRMRVNLNVTFPSLACEDLHVDVMDVAGDSQLNVEETMAKRRLNPRGMPLGQAEVVSSNQNQHTDTKKKEILKSDLPEDYCGPCFGAGDENVTCCNTCDDLIEAYTKKRWRTDVITMTSEQCIREGRDKNEPKRMKRGEGCNLAGSMTLNRVAGNFHIAMGEGVERDGRHIHAFVPEDTPNFNASHIIHHLSFGSTDETWAESYLDGASKIVTKELGTTGLFQYFIKVVPTTYINPQGGKGGRPSRKESNRYFVTERFRPLMREYVEDDDATAGDDEEASASDPTKAGRKLPKTEDGKALADATYKGGHSHAKHHDVKNAILPGVFFIYEIYPFAVEVTPTSVPWTHLLIRIMATVGGVITMVRWADSLFFRTFGKGKRSSMVLE